MFYYHKKKQNENLRWFFLKFKMIKGKIGHNIKQSTQTMLFIYYLQLLVSYRKINYSGNALLVRVE